MHSIPLAALCAGLAGTLATHLLLFSLSHCGVVRVRLAVKLGSLILRRTSGVRHQGLLLHYVFGLLFALIYTNLVILAEPASVAGIFGLSWGFGAIHATLAVMLLKVFSKFHPVPEFRRVSAGALLAYAGAHLVYATGVAGVLAAWMTL